MKKSIKLLVTLFLYSNHSNLYCFFENFFNSSTKEQSSQQSHYLPKSIIINNNNNNTHNQHTTLFSGTDLISSERLQRISQETKVYYDNLFDYIKNNKSTLIKASLLTTYMGTQGLLFYLRSALTKKNRWSSWKEHITLDELYVMPQSILAEELLHDIQKSYVNIKNPTDFVTPLINFINEVEKERHLLQLYRSLVSLLNMCYINRLFFCNQQLFTTSEFRLKRLDYIHRSFLAWLTDFKVTNSISPKARRHIISQLLKSSPVIV